MTLALLCPVCLAPYRLALLPLPAEWAELGCCGRCLAAGRGWVPLVAAA